jgi:hypothetical protein
MFAFPDLQCHNLYRWGMFVVQLFANCHTADVISCRQQTKQSHEPHFLITQHHVHFTAQCGSPVSPPPAHSLVRHVVIWKVPLAVFQWQNCRENPSNGSKDQMGLTRYGDPESLLVP